MKAVFISFNMALTDPVLTILDRQHVRGFTKWENVYGRGSFDGEPHYGSHTWPSINSAIIAVVSEEKVDPLLNALRKLDEKTKMQGLRAYVWNVEKGM